MSVTASSNKQRSSPVNPTSMISEGAYITYNDVAIRNNFMILEYSRTCQAAVRDLILFSGCASGILGLTGPMGFIFYFICVIFQAIVWEYKSGFKCNTYFANRSIYITYSLMGGLFTYILLWVFIYGMVHVY